MLHTNYENFFFSACKKLCLDVSELPIPEATGQAQVHDHGLLKLAVGFLPQGSSVVLQAMRTWGPGASQGATEMRPCGLDSKEFGRSE